MGFVRRLMNLATGLPLGHVQLLMTNTWASSNWSIGRREREERNPLHSQSKAGHWSHLRMLTLQRLVDGHDIDGTGTTVDCR